MFKSAVTFFRNVVLLAVIGMLINACVPPPEPLAAIHAPSLTPPPTASPTSTDTPSSTPTATPSPTLTRTPTLPPYISSASPEKQTFIAVSTVMQSTQDAMPTVAKTPVPTDPNASCPSTPLPVGIFPYDVPGPFFSGDTIENRAVAKASTGFYYEIWAGAPQDDPHKGLIRVFEDDPDFCASVAKGKLFSIMQDFIGPTGPITITKIVGDELLFRVPGGKTGRFNYVTGTYLP